MAMCKKHIKQHLTYLNMLNIYFIYTMTNLLHLHFKK